MVSLLAVLVLVVVGGVVCQVLDGDKQGEEDTLCDNW